MNEVHRFNLFFHSFFQVEPSKTSIMLGVSDSITDDKVKDENLDPEDAINIRLDEGLRTHNDEKSVECPWPGCDARFRQKGNMKVHYRDHNGEKPYSCIKCDKHYKQKGALQQHNLVHHTSQEDRKKLKTVVCEDCGAAFETVTLLKEHKSHVHTSESEKPFACSICPFRYTTSTQLKNHENKHLGITEEKKYVCSKCSYKAKSKTDLTKHERIHTGEKPFKCETCGKTFTDTSQLRSHMRVHTGGRVSATMRYECPVCHKKGYDRSNMKKHIKIHGRDTELIDLEDHKNKNRITPVSDPERRTIEAARDKRIIKKNSLKCGRNTSKPNEPNITVNESIYQGELQMTTEESHYGESNYGGNLHGDSKVKGDFFKEENRSFLVKVNSKN